MPHTFATRYRARGTRFRVYPQSPGLRGLARPEVVYVGAEPGTLREGPQDDRLYIVDAVAKTAYYEATKAPERHPPYLGPRYPPPAPGPDGHYDHIGGRERAFASATVFASVRLVLDLWEEYLGRQIAWFFRSDYHRLEVIPVVNTQNAYSRYGYLEFGFADARGRVPYRLIFDAVAHETAHAVIHSLVGWPGERRSLAYRAFDEALADLLAIVSALNFDSVVDRLLATTKGRLFSKNLVSRIGEVPKRVDPRGAIRNTYSRATLATVRLTGDVTSDKYRLAAPLAGGAFDLFVEMYEERLVARGAIRPVLAAASAAFRRRRVAPLQREFGRRYAARPRAFRDALLDARDAFGRLLARTLDKTSARGLTFARVVANMLAADRELYGGRHRALIRAAFERRRILPAGSGGQ
ncbi:MAG: hypothetical protein ACRELS_07010 [Candidatus Rokuibacteriota bacterium]